MLPQARSTPLSIASVHSCPEGCMCQGQIVYIYHIFCKPASVLLCFQKNIKIPACPSSRPQTHPPAPSRPRPHTQHSEFPVPFDAHQNVHLSCPLLSPRQGSQALLSEHSREQTAQEWVPTPGRRGLRRLRLQAQPLCPQTPSQRCSHAHCRERRPFPGSSGRAVPGLYS